MKSNRYLYAVAFALLATMSGCKLHNSNDYENLMADSSTQLDGYWDRKNPFVIIVLLILLGIIIFGTIFLVMGA